jgi:hypothetical protein
MSMIAAGIASLYCTVPGETWAWCLLAFVIYELCERGV